ncbi:MAG: 16S rRNA (guanine(966)-N(2))-methyltransferase RsmD [Planctomycetes bacterium]|nr:16S rRNA (guanine(966)-N(2))-methyltransferase RsmD [Planctomycetota bacterium]
MRIIAGEHRGRRIQAPDGEATRPMLDRVREALFGTLGERVEGAQVLDLFAGSGSLSLEALSRGADAAVLLERNSKALEALHENVEELGLAQSVYVVRGNALDPRLWRPNSKPGRPQLRERFELVFYDPPYPLLEDPKTRGGVLGAVDELLANFLAPGGMLVFHTPARGTEWARLSTPCARETRVYGSSALLYLSLPGA